MIREPIFETRQNVMGGEGELKYYHIETEEELLGHARLYAKIVLPPGTSIGWHQHVGETEPYYVLAGAGLFKDKDGEHAVKAGDCCIIKPGDFHAIRNDGDVDLALIALIHKD